ncbi:hypothetical protein C8R45DRAFT_464983 [Mycena sanguinolenta]|nr:hypothetical protein C8R45DRAFT_464983 [Mycena sanguinolenta]
MPAERTVTRTTHPATPRSLKVTTAAPPPSLEIISPTPRTFTFPNPHNLCDTPETSPSNSPFEPDRAPDLSALSTSRSSSASSNDECRTPPPLSAFTRTLTPLSAPASPSPSPAPIRRKSTSAATEERRPKKGDDDYVKRPENAFILFRRKCCGDRALSLASSSAPSSDASGPSFADSPALAGKKQRQADLSKTISQQWRALSPEERSKWEELAKEKKREHEALHPNYVYRPQRSNKNRANASSSSSSPTTQRRKHSAPPSQQIEFVIPAPRAPHGRSSSVPAPPPHQAIQIPNVYLPASSTSSFSLEGSTSLMPMLTRRGARDESGAFAGGFDYMPSSAAFDFETSLQSSNFLRAMFQNSASLASNEMLSPASSTSGSGPSSPYTPATTSFHPSAFTCTFPGSAAPGDASYATSSEMLDASSLTSEPAVAGATDSDYSSLFASASSPWASSTTGALTERDFDIEHISEIEWDLGCAAFPPTQPAFPGSEFVSLVGEGMDMEFGEQPLGGELDLFGNLNMNGDMGFDEMMAGRDF